MATKSKPKKKECGGCDQFDRETKGKPGGFCRRYPPTDRKFPIVMDDMVCGEFKAKQ